MPSVADASAPLQIRFVNPGFASGGFWRSVSDTMSAAAEQLGISLEISYGEREWPRMRQNAEAAIASPSPPDYLILVNEHGQAADLVRDANDRGIPTLLLLNDLTERQVARVGRAGRELPYWLGSLTPDNERAGHEMATALFDAAHRLHPRRQRIALMTLAGDFATPASQARLAGLDRALAAAPDVDELRRLMVDWSYDEAYRRIDTWLSTGRRFDAIWAANDPIALGAMAAARRHGLAAGQDYAVVGMNWSSPALASVRNGEMTLTHGGHFLAGAWAMVLLYDLYHGIDVTAETPHLRFPMAALRAPIPPALRDVLTEKAWSRIDFRRFSRYLHPGRDRYDFSLTALQSALRPLEAPE
nr:ABC transporter substrate-binding protein [Halomonas getboli]